VASERLSAACLRRRGSWSSPLFFLHPPEPSVQLTKILECLAVWSTLVLLLLLGRQACRHFHSRFCASLTLLQLQLLLPPLPFSTIHLLENQLTLNYC
jgi:hypothetical protein